MARSMQRHLREGWMRAVFAAPETRPSGSRDERVLEGPGRTTPLGPGTLDAIIARAEEEARAGRVKHTYLLDPRTRIQIDARYGAAKVRDLDDRTLTKMMGGKDRFLRPDRSADLLRAIGIMNADGTMSAHNARKYKQVNHFVELCRPAWETASRSRPLTDADPLRALDLACGNGYLTLVLAEALRLSDVPTRLHGVDRRADVVERCRARAEGLGLAQTSFEIADIASVDLAQSLGGSPDLVVALHACDTATDQALALAITAGAAAILAAPCCQAEVARQVESAPIAALARHGLLTREYGAVVTDGIRADVLTAAGYTVDVIEFISSEHTPKNTLLRARRRPDAPVTGDYTEVRQWCDALGIQPSLLALLEG